MEVAYHVDALLLALAASTDNFMVGISMGMGRRKRTSSDGSPWLANGIISLCNAGGAYFASHGGLWVKDSLYIDQRFSLYLSSLAFGVLTCLEYRGYRDDIRTTKVDRQDPDPSPSEQHHPIGHSGLRAPRSGGDRYGN